MIITSHTLRLFLLLITVHTFGVGVVLIIAGNDIMTMFGFVELQSRFFQMQGGVFHIVVTYAYWLAYRDPVRFEHLVIFIIFVKAVAAIFLFSYYFFIEQVIMVLLSGIVDAGMGIILYILYSRWRTLQHAER